MATMKKRGLPIRFAKSVFHVAGSLSPSELATSIEAIRLKTGLQLSHLAHVPIRWGDLKKFSIAATSDNSIVRRAAETKLRRVGFTIGRQRSTTTGCN